MTQRRPSSEQQRPPVRRVTINIPLPTHLAVAALVVATIAVGAFAANLAGRPSGTAHPAVASQPPAAATAGADPNAPPAAANPTAAAPVAPPGDSGLGTQRPPTSVNAGDPGWSSTGGIQGRALDPSSHLAFPPTQPVVAVPYQAAASEASTPPPAAGLGAPVAPASVPGHVRDRPSLRTIATEEHAAATRQCHRAMGTCGQLRSGSASRPWPRTARPAASHVLIPSH
jgi:hypothetical protein